MVWNPTRGSGSSAQSIDSFEDQDLSEYSGDAGSFDIEAEGNVTPNAVDGTYLLESTGTSNIQIISTSGLANYFPKGTIAKVYVYSTTNGDIARLRFAVQDSGSFYRVELRFNSGDFTLTKLDSFSATTLATDSQAYSTGQWYTVQITRDDGTLGGSDNDITAELLDGIDGTSVNTLSANDSTFATEDGIGFRVQKPNANGQFYFDHYHLP
jgi:hypothetical protein